MKKIGLSLLSIYYYLYIHVVSFDKCFICNAISFFFLFLPFISAWWSLEMLQVWPSSSSAVCSISWLPMAFSLSSSRAILKVMCGTWVHFWPFQLPLYGQPVQKCLLNFRWKFFTDVGHISYGLQWAEFHCCSEPAVRGMQAIGSVNGLMVLVLCGVIRHIWSFLLIR